MVEQKQEVGVANKTFSISVVRVEYSQTEIKVVANSEAEAEKLALEKAPSIGFNSSYYSEYKLERDI